MLYLEDLKKGDKYISETYEITAENIVRFAEHFDPQPFHLCDEQAKESFFEGLAASGWQVGSITMRLMAQTLPIATGVIGGGVDLKWLSPTRPGDVLHIEINILDVIPSKSKPDRGVVNIHVRTINQQDQVRQTIDCTLLVFTKSSGMKGGIYAP